MTITFSCLILAYANYGVRMPRPFKCRRVAFSPETKFFKPAGIPVSQLNEITLTLDELEAVRLADLIGMYQEEAAQQMNVSRQTFGNIIAAAHKKIADCLINSKALKINGGSVEMTERKFSCSDCNHEWTEPFGTGRPEHCPQCQSVNIHRHPQDRGQGRQFCGGQGKKI